MKGKFLVFLTGVITGICIGAALLYKMQLKALEKLNAKTDKFKQYYNTLNQWLNNKDDGKSSVNFFKRNGYQSVAIYGMGELGNRLYKELRNSDIKIKYVIDQSIDYLNHEVSVMSPEDRLEAVDVIVVTPTFAFEDIRSKLKAKINCPIISINEVLYEIDGN
ncbi:hypothetical protein [Anaerosacchariphilus polymeriproducens]|uniref:D-isomer specific 2-hydroxyacid dehydrogenase NAD-binding domain-containing protein n=1 Tax=Anaerosacchariphilus polymeriproducens TaxID=1812858 RepID=A0A371ATK2_9FIRM|nr:hypothetical protein [Anaerosacchariphilus polymeriproducens]RDU22810.1 hypothetical protein DWV06_12750 [Anaerosacchariphilus polymeriproducens]